MSRNLMDRIYRELHYDAYQWAKHCMGNSEDQAADILQSAYLKIMSGKARYDGKSKLKTWLFSVIRFTAADHFRSVRPMEPLDNIMEQTLESVDGEMDHHYYRRILGQLTENQSRVLLLVFYHDYTLEAVAEVLGLSIGTVRTHYDRGKKKLRAILEKENNNNYERG